MDHMTLQLSLLIARLRNATTRASVARHARSTCMPAHRCSPDDDAPPSVALCGRAAPLAPAAAATSSGCGTLLG
eukprot:8204430-Lingulodinium_polyedra.AAC.1